MIDLHPNPHRNYLNAGYSARSWLFTVDHKRIAILYMVSVTLFFFVGGAAAVLFRLELMTPAGDLVISETYNRLFTLHGIVMIFFFLIPAIPAVLGNFLIPMMIGARDLAFPKINLLSWYLFMAGGVFAVWALVDGGVDTGWTFYSPFSTTYSNSNVMLTLIGAFIVGFSSILTGLNFVVTIHTMRAPGLTWFRLPLFVWAHYATSHIMILGTPVLASTLFLLALERGLKIGIFDPKLGGDPILFQHLFWFYSHHGRGERDHRLLLPQANLRLPLHRHVQHGYRRDRLPGVGAPHVRQRAVGVRGHGVLVLEHVGGGPFGHQGLQLDRHAA
jgi:cytochrome c oxidase subunit 1